MKFTLQFDMDNAAFWDDKGNFNPIEVKRILERVANKSEHFEDLLDGAIRDINGHKIGQWEVERGE